MAGVGLRILFAEIPHHEQGGGGRGGGSQEDPVAVLFKDVAC